MIGVCALIPAAGRGVRFGAAENKVFAPIAGRPLLGWTLQAFADCALVDSVVLLGNEDDLPRLREIGDTYGGGKVIAVLQGGAERQATVRLGLAAVGNAKWVVIHDAARPCVTPQLIAETIEEARLHHAAYAALPLVDTLVRSETLDSATPVSRDDLWVVQTPQAFGIVLIRQAHRLALENGWSATDDAGLVRLMGHGVRRVTGSPENLKVTHPGDIALAAAILGGREVPNPPAPFPTVRSSLQGRGSLKSGESSSEERTAQIQAPPSLEGVERGTNAATGREGGGGLGTPFRIGHGYDVHAFAPDRPLWLGGVHFPDASRGLLGHSDADVLLHALCDALLGAAGMGDIGVLFPPSDDRHKDRRSIEFVHEVKKRLDAAGWRVGNVDMTVLAETPKINPRVPEMRAVIADALDVASDQIGIKATTNEGLGFVGRGEGISAHATTLLFRA